MSPVASAAVHHHRPEHEAEHDQSGARAPAPGVADTKLEEDRVSERERPYTDQARAQCDREDHEQRVKRDAEELLHGYPTRAPGISENMTLYCSRPGGAVKSIM